MRNPSAACDPPNHLLPCCYSSKSTDIGKNMRKKSCIIFIILIFYPTVFLHALSDLDILLMIKSSLIGPSGSGLPDWVAPLPPSPAAHCSFSGITCDAESRVASLSIVNAPLLGTLPPEIGLLDNLVNLTLAADNLTGPLPKQLSRLASLKHLNLSYNGFSGELPDNMLIKLTRLEAFDVYSNNFVGNLPVGFVKLKKLGFLNLAGNYFTGEIPSIYSEFKSLTHLSLQGNSLTGRIPARLARIPNLQELSLGYYNTYEGGIPPEFGFLSTLQLLNLGECNLTGEIPATLGNLKHLRSLFLQMNNLSGQIPAELSGLVSLMSLDLSVNSLTGVIPEQFSQLNNLTLINLFKNNFQGPFPRFIGDLPYLEVLQIWHNNFTLELPENLGGNRRLTLIDVSNNHLTGTIPKDLCKGGKLKILILMENYFYGPIPDEIGNCKSLVRVRLKNNFLNGTIPAGFFRLPTLDMLELKDNYVTGELPERISASKLSNLDLSNNRITGKIPESVGNLTNLEILSLDRNKFSAEIPSNIFNLKKLSMLNLSGNGLTGEIPASIANCSHLTFIDLSGNNLEGSIPVSISILQNLNVLNLSTNQLDGSIPGEIGLMESLTILDLSYNDFSGRRPDSGLLKDLDDRFFAGNPKLCPPHATYCPSSTPSQSLHKSQELSITIIIILSVLFLLLIPGIWIIIRKRRLKKSRTWKLTAFQNLDFQAEDVLECIKEENIIGKGGAGIVYRGSMANETYIAIKRVHTRGRNDHGFMAEILTLGRIRHRNIVRLLGYVSNKDTNLLLYEYMPNGSLGEILRGAKGARLQWEPRFKIAVDAAKGLCYLHHDCSPSIIHRDVKSNNILVDGDYEAHVADFGLAKLWDDGQCMSSIAGSYGYIAPEYAYTLKVDKKSDVYSFGVVLLELITGRKPVGEFGDGVDIVRWVRKTASELSPPSESAAAVAVVDPRLNEYPVREVVKVFKIAMACVEEESSARPTMRQVVHMLTNPPTPADVILIQDSAM